MTDSNVDDDTGDKSMERIRVVWQFNPITVVPILSAIIGGAVWAKSLEWRVSDIETYRAARSAIVDKSMESVRDIPYRMDLAEKALAAQAEKDKAQDARMDRQSDLILDGQEKMRKTVQDGFDGIKSNISSLSTKVEVISSKMGLALPQPGSYRAK